MSRSLVIVGDGIIGRCVAYYAVDRGFAVTILERHPADHGGCSFGNAGMIVPSHFTPLAAPGMVALGLKWMLNPRSPFYIKPRLSWSLLNWGLKFNRAATKARVNRAAPVLRDLNLASRACYEQLADDLGDDFFLTRRGLLMLCKTAQSLDEEAHLAQTARQLGIPAEVLNAPAAGQIDPGVTMDIAGAVYFPKDCHLSPAKFMESLGNRLRQRGVTFLHQTEVTAWRTSAGVVNAVATPHGDVTADEFVLCGGSWSPQTVQSLGLNLPMQAGKGYSVTLQNPRQLPGLCSIFTEARVAVTPMNGSLRFGGTMEIAGLSETVSTNRVKGIIDSIPHYFPAFKPEDFEGLKPWAGLRPCPPDGMPYVGRFKKYRNLSAATGHSMMGLSLGPITGQLLADVLVGEKPQISIELLDPDRYARA